jgi:hypothetical protein
LRQFVKKITERFNFDLRIKLNGKKFVIPIIKNIGVWHISQRDGLWIIELINKLLKIKHGSFIDVGVNIGQTISSTISTS